MRHDKITVKLVDFSFCGQIDGDQDQFFCVSQCRALQQKIQGLTFLNQEKHDRFETEVLMMMDSAVFLRPSKFVNDGWWLHLLEGRARTIN